MVIKESLVQFMIDQTFKYKAVLNGNVDFVTLLIGAEGAKTPRKC